MSGGKIVEGIFAINKPASITSAQVLREVQRIFNSSRLFAPWLAAQEAARAREQQHQPHYQKRRRRNNRRLEVKIGHGGTLDPMATGVLIVGVGAGTKGLGSFLECTKSYETAVLFGASSDTYDVTGKLLGRANTAHLTREKVEKALDAFRGTIIQRPPMYSALRVQGKRLYEYAREGKELPVDIKERELQVHDLNVVQWMEADQHDFHWPIEEANVEEKTVAAELLDASTEPTKDDEREADASLKRKHSEGEVPPDSKGAEAPSQPKAAKLDADAVEERAKDPEPEQTEEHQTATIAPSTVEQHDATPQSPGSTKGKKSKSKFYNKIQYSPSNDLGAKADAPAAKIAMTVSSGFYVRSLCHDLGRSVDSLGVMATLVRTRQAEYELGKNAIDYDDFSKGEEIWGPKLTTILEGWQSKKDQVGN